MRSARLRPSLRRVPKHGRYFLQNESVALLQPDGSCAGSHPTRMVIDRSAMDWTRPSRRFCSMEAISYVDRILGKLSENNIDDAAQIFDDEWTNGISKTTTKETNGVLSDISKILEQLHRSPHQAEQFLKALHDREIHSTLDQYMLILTGWMQQDLPSAKRAQRLLDYMQQELGIAYDVKSCNLVLKTWARLNNAEGAEKLFRKMLAQKVPVNVESFSHVLEAWSKSKSALAFKKADALLSSMSDPHHKLQPTIACYLWTLSSWSKTKRKGSEGRLEALYSELFAAIKKSSSSEDHDPEMIQLAVLRLIQAYASLDNAHKSEEILLAFANVYEKKNTNLAAPPTMDMCLLVLTTWSRSKSSRRGSRAEKFLSLMEKDDTLPNPNVACCTAVLNCLAGSNKPNAAQRAELLLRMMEANPETQPNLMTYTCVLNAWARSKDVDAAHQVERLYEEMIDRGIEADRRVFAVLISAWGRSSQKEAVEHAEHYFEQVKALSKSSADPANTPTVVEYTATMQAWANHVIRNVQQSREAVARVEGLLEEMMDSGEEHLRPNSVTYAAVLKTIAGARRIPDRRERAEGILKIMDSQRVEVTPFIESIVQKCSWRE